MAKKIVDEQIKLSIVIDGDEGQKELYNLEKSTRELSAANKELLVEKTKLEKQGKKESEAYKTVTATIRQNNQVIKENKARMSELQNQIGLTGLTMAQLQTKANLLKTTLRHLVPGSADYIRYDTELKKVSARIDELRGKAQATGLTLGAVADKFNRYAAMGATVIATLAGVAISIQKIIDYNGKLSDSQADVMKTTGMTKQEVDELTKSFGLLKTRTQRIDLLKIAEEGGRIGILNNEMQDFVRVMDIANVALGDSFTGGVEEVASKLGKLKMLFAETKDMNVQDAYMAIGSAINDLGANGVATENNITEFTTRIGSLPDQLKPSIAETLALGAAFEESGIEAEVSARAYSIFLNRASTETASFARVMGLPVEKVKEMINANPLEFFLTFAERLKNINPEATEMSQLLDELGINADGANKVIGAAANNTQRFRDTIELSNASMADGSSLMNEFNVKNNNLAATLEKIKKTVIGWYSSETFVKWLTDAVTWFGKLIGATDDVDHSTTTFRNNLYFLAKLFTILIAGLLSYNLAMKVYTLWTTRGTQGTVLFNAHLKIQTALQKLATVSTSLLAAKQSIAAMSTHLFAAAKLRLAGNTAAATAQMNLFRIAFMATPWGLLIGLVTALATAFYLFRDETDKVNDALMAKSEIEKQAGESTAKHKGQVNNLIEVLRSSTASIEQKEKALAQLKKITNGYLDTLTLENIKTLEGINLISNYIKHVDALARAKATVSLKSKLYEQQLENEGKIKALSAEKSATSATGRGLGSDGKLFGFETSRNKKVIQTEIDEIKRQNESINNQLGAVKDTQSRSITYLQKSIETDKNKLVWMQKGTTAYINLANKIRSEEERLSAFLQVGTDSPEIDIPTNNAPGYTPLAKKQPKTGKTDAEKAADKELKTQESEHEKRLEEIKKFHEDKLKLQREYEDGNYALMADGYAKEKAILETQSSRKIEDLRARLIDEEQIKLAQTQAENEKLTTEQRKSYADLAQAWQENNAEIHRKIEQETDLHLIQLATLVEKYSVSEVEKLKQKYDEEKLVRDTAFNQQLAALGTNERAKEKLKKEYEKAELEAEQKHLESLVAVYNEMMAGGTIGGIDFSLLSNEDAAELKKNIDIVNNAISQLLAKKAALKNGGEEKGIDLSNGETSLGMGQNDILGFSPDQWKTFFENIQNGTIGIETMGMAVMAIQNLWAQYDAMVSAGENRRLQQYENASNKKERRLKMQLDRGLISQDQYNKATEAIEADMNRKKAEIEYKQAKRKRAMDMANVIVSTSMAIMQAYAQMGPVAGTIAAVLVGTMGALQLATIRKQPLPSVSGYEQGLYGDHLVRREQDGKVFKTTYGGKTRSGLVNKNTMYMVGENGPEMIIDNKAFRKMNPQLRDSLIRELRGIKGFENGYYKEQSMQVAVPEAGNLSNSELIAAIIQLNQLLTRLEENGVRAYVSNKDYKSMKNVRDGIRDFENFRNRNKVS